jgi:anti-sigma factor ChrR (cupin superfamily)
VDQPRQSKERCEPRASTLGDLLRVGLASAQESESDWVGLVRAVGRGDQRAFQGLYDRASRLVFTLGYRITRNLETAEEVTLAVFHEVWRRALYYDPANGSVLGWIMNLARSRAIDRLRFEDRKKRLEDQGNAIVRETSAHPLRLDEAVDVLRLSASAWPRLEAGIGPARTDAGGAPAAWSEPEWLDVATGIEYRILVTDGERGLVSMLVRLAPGATYPAHTHADLEELHLLAGQLWINDRELHAGDHHLAHRGSSDLRVMSETGCTCLLITSTHDELSRGREEA